MREDRPGSDGPRGNEESFQRALLTIRFGIIDPLDPRCCPLLAQTATNNRERLIERSARTP